MIIPSYLELIWYYLLVGTLIGFILENSIRWVGDKINWIERFWLITLWPLMILSFIYYFIVGLFNSDD